MTATLTDRYVAATVRHLPEEQRPDIERELRAAIADDIDARTDAGEKPDGAEYAALLEFGDPARLAARYAQRPDVLIGPAVYRSYLKAVRAACAAVLPVVYVVLVLVEHAHGDGIWATIFRPAGITLTVAMYLLVAVTAAYALAGRQPGHAAAAAAEPWTPERLATEERPPPGTWGDLVTGVVLSAFAVIALFVQRAVSPVTTPGGRAVPIIDPALWHFWVWYFTAVLAAALALGAAGLRLGRWHPAAAVAGTVLSLAAAVPLGWLFWQARLINRALAHGGVLSVQGSWIAWLAILILALLVARTLAVTWRPGRRDAPGPHR